jgi:preprotein translocase subunit Sss1
MKGSLWIIAIASFIGGIVTFSNGYGAVVRYLETPTWLGLLMIAFWLVLLLFLIGVMGFIMYVTDRKVGNVKVKIHLFERLLGFDKNAELPQKKEQA